MAIIQYQTAPNIAQAYLQAYQRPAGARDRSQGIKNIFDSIGNQISENDRKRLIASYGNSETPKSLEQVAAEQNYVSTGDLGAMQNYQTRMDNAAYTQSQKEATEAENKTKDREINSDNLRTVNSELINLRKDYQLAKDNFDAIALDSPGKKEAEIDMDSKKALLADKMAFSKYLEGKLGYTGQETLETAEPSNITSSNITPSNITPSTVSVTAFEHYPGEISTYNNAKLLLDTEENTVPSSNNTLNEENTVPKDEVIPSSSAEVMDSSKIAIAPLEALVNYTGTWNNDDKLKVIARLKTFSKLSEPSKTKAEANQRMADKNKLLRRLDIDEQDLAFINTKVAATKEELNAKANTDNQNKFKKDLENAYANDATASVYIKNGLYDNAATLLYSIKTEGIDAETKRKIINEFINSKKGK